MMHNDITTNRPTVARAARLRSMADDWRELERLYPPSVDPDVADVVADVVHQVALAAIEGLATFAASELNTAEALFHLSRAARMAMLAAFADGTVALGPATTPAAVALAGVA